MKKVLVDVDEALWGRMKARAAEREELIATTVARAFREHLAWQKDGPEESSREVAPRPSNEPSNGPSNEPEGLAPVSAVERLRALVNQVRPGSVQTARELARAREARRGDEGGSQVPPDEEFGF